MIGLIVDGNVGGTQAAFLEECPHGIVLRIDRPLETAIATLLAAGVSKVIPGTSGAASFARQCAVSLGLDPLSVPTVDANRDSGIGVCSEPRVAVDLVSLNGVHVNAGVYELRVDVRNGVPILRHRLSVPPQEDVAVAAFGFARVCLDGLGVRDGATCVEIAMTPAGPRMLTVSSAPVSPTMSADAAFTAFGHSHQHLYIESVLRPNEFERRIARPLTPGRTTLAIAPLWNWKANVSDGFAGLRVLRRLTGFHSISAIRLHESSDGPVAFANFVHVDRASVANSLAILHEFEDSNAFFARESELIGFSAAAA